MINYLRRADISTEKWDDCIRNASNGLVYGYSWYLDLVSPEWEALVEGDYRRVFPLTHRRKFGINYLYQPFFTQQLGVFSTDPLSEEIVGSFIEAIPPKYRFAEINLNSQNKLAQDKFNIVRRLNLELDLNFPYENLYKNYSQNTKRNIKKAIESGITVTKNVRPDDLIILFRKNKGKEILHLMDKDYLLLKRVVYACLHKGMAQVWGAYTATNDLCAGIIFIFSHQRAIFYFSATNETARENGAMPFLIDTFIKEHAQSREIFDFEGSNDINLARFYKSFGAVENQYHQLVVNKLPGVVCLGLKIVKDLRKRLGYQSILFL
ncbi:MAG: hypothetical protein NT175_02130 [Bacteroidetes bacterium]|nr:hypothetical protein [Bacteroidota bacterium]